MSLNRLLTKRKVKKMVPDLANVFAQFIFKYIDKDQHEEIEVEELREVTILTPHLYPFIFI